MKKTTVDLSLFFLAVLGFSFMGLSINLSILGFILMIPFATRKMLTDAHDLIKHKKHLN